MRCARRPLAWLLPGRPRLRDLGVRSRSLRQNIACRRRRLHRTMRLSKRPLFLKIRIMSSLKFRKTENGHASAERSVYFVVAWPPAGRAALRAREVALARSRSIWALGSVTQISPIHSSLTPLIGLALKLVRLTRFADLPRSIVFR